MASGASRGGSAGQDTGGGPARTIPPLLRMTAVAQGVYYVLTGVWGVVELDSFQAVTGPKVELWLVRTVGVLVTAIGAALLVAVRRGEIAAEEAVLGVGSALGLAAIDVSYVLAGRIPPIYLADAALELVLVVLWVAGLRRARPA
jgi:hypothetical protein